MNLKKYIKVYSLFLYTSLASEMEYKTNVIIDFITAMGHAHSTSTVSDNTVTAAKLNDAIGITNTPIRKNTNRIQTGFTLDSNDNAMVAGPITIDSGVSVVINGSLSIV